MGKDKLYIRHILDAIFTIGQYMSGVEYEDFLGDKLRQDGAIRELEIIGEASKQLSLEFKEKYPDIPWKDIAGMRDKLIHEYCGVDLNAVWETVEDDLPILKSALQKELE